MNTLEKIRQLHLKLEEILSLAQEGLLKSERLYKTKYEVEDELKGISNEFDERTQLSIEKAIPKWRNVPRSGIFVNWGEVTEQLIPTITIVNELLSKLGSPTRNILPNIAKSPTEEKSVNTTKANEATGIETTENLSDEALLAIIRRAENTHIPGSLYQRANTEWQIRHQQRIVEATKGDRGGIMFEVGGDMTNHGVIQTGRDAIVDIAVAGNYSSNDKTRIIQGVQDSKKEWYERPFGKVLLTVIAGLIIAGIIFYLHWN